MVWHYSASARSIPFSGLAVSARLLGRDAFQLAVFSRTRIKSGVSWFGRSRLRLPDAGAGEAQHLHCTAHTDILEPQGGRPPKLSLQRGCIYHLALEAPLFKGMSTGLKAFLESPGVCGFRPCARTHLKKPCVTLVWLVGRTTNTKKRSGLYHEEGYLFFSCFSRARTKLQLNGPWLRVGHLPVSDNAIDNHCIALDSRI